MIIFIEIVLVLIAAALGFFGAQEAVEATLLNAAERPGALLRTEAEVLEVASAAAWQFLGGTAALLAGRLVGLRRGGRHIGVPLMLPALVLAMALGLMIQLGYGDPTRGAGWPGPGFAQGVLIAGILGGLVLASPWEPDGAAWKLRWPLLAAVIGIPLLLRAVGFGPAGSDTYINLGTESLSFQPLELAKLAFAIVLGLHLAEVATRLRHHRVRVGPFRMLRPDLLVGSMLVLAALIAGLVLVRDLGPTLILAALYLAMFYATSRSRFWAGMALVVVALVSAFVITHPDAVGETVRLRLLMWLEPWTNGLKYGAQLGHSLWAIGSGGVFGLGAGEAHIAGLEAGHTDLVMAHLAEEQGAIGLFAYMAVIGILVLQGLVVAVYNRTPRRALMAASLSMLLFLQWLVIFGGTTGGIPLTGVVAPYLSDGKSSMIAFVLLATLVLRLAEDGRARTGSNELMELRAGLGEVGVVAAAGLAIAVVTVLELSVFDANSIATRTITRTLGDGTVVVEANPRLERIAASIPRGPYLDPEGEVLVGADSTPEAGLGIGTLLGPLEGRTLLRHPWQLNRLHQERLRGYGSLEPVVWEGTPYAVPDFRPLLPLLRLSPDERAEKIAEIAADEAGRSVTLSLDADLQRAATAVLADYVDAGEAGAIVVIDVDTGRVVARAQSPDLDLSDPQVMAAVRAGDPVVTGVYGAWSDQTQLIVQTGSVFKLFTALVAVREGYVGTTQQCVRRDASGPYFTRPGWGRGIHDYYKDDTHGTLGLSRAIEVSCNVFFGQLALELGPQAFRDLVAAGVEVGWSEEFDPGRSGGRDLGSTGFGQGAAAMSPLQVARLVAAIGAGGVYRRCPDDLSVDSACEETPLTTNTRGVEVILKGMRKVMETGTAWRLDEVDGIRIYGKSGTADDPGRADEVPYGYVAGEYARPHSWFVAIAEPDTVKADQADTPGRLVVVVLVPRGGGGTNTAGKAAVEVIREASEAGRFDGAS